MRASAGIAAAMLVVLAGARPLAQAPTPASLRAQGFAFTYNLDYEQAIATFDRALALDAENSATHRARAAVIWLHIIFRRGSITVDQYLGGAPRGDLTLEKPPAEEAATFTRHVERALALAERRLAANPKDVGALYDVGAAVGLKASYAASVEGRIGGAFGAARRAYDTHEKVLDLDPARKEAGLVVGTYRYIVATLALPARWLAYLVGFGGDKSKGLRLIEEAAAHPSDVQVDAKFALLLLYSREGRFEEALAVVKDLMARFPRNRVVRLEAGATAIRARQYSEAERLLTAGIDALPSDPRPRAFGEEALWYYKRGLARLSLRRLDGAREDLARADQQPARTWVKARIRLEQGKLADLENRRAEATKAYAEAARLASAGSDPPTRREAERWMREAYR